MTDQYFDERLLEQGFPSHEQPNYTLARLRRELEGRLTWLEHYLTPDRSGRGRPGSALTDKGLLDKDLFKAIAQVVDSANSVAHGRTVEPAQAAAIVEAGVQVIEVLDRLIVSTQEKVAALKPEARLVYLFLELPTTRRERISRDYDVFTKARDSESRIKQARAVLKEARRSERLRQLWDAVTEASLERPAEAPNPFLGAQSG